MGTVAGYADIDAKIVLARPHAAEAARRLLDEGFRYDVQYHGDDLVEITVSERLSLDQTSDRIQLLRRIAGDAG